MLTNYLVQIMDDKRTEVRHITVMAKSEDHADTLGRTAAALMEEEWYEGRVFYVDMVWALE